MNRKYNKNEFYDKVAEIRKIRPDIALTTDVIVGFPEETEEDFIETMNFCKEINFAKIHVFPYSKRNGTKAASMENQVDEKIKKDRAKRLGELSNQLEDAYYQKFIGKKLEVLIETNQDGKSVGHTSNYLKVEVEGVYPSETLVMVQLNSVANKIAKGTVLEKVQN